MTQTGSPITNSATNFFGSNSNISLAPNGIYEIDIILYFIKTGNGTVQWTFAYNAAPTSLSFDLWTSPTAGIVVPPGSNNTSLFSQIYNNTANPYTFTQGSISGGTNNYAKFKCILIAGATTNYMKIQAQTANGGNSLTPGIGSRWYCKKLSSANVGNFAA